LFFEESIHREENPKIGERWGSVTWDGAVADPLKQATCYHVKFGSSTTKAVVYG